MTIEEDVADLQDRMLVAEARLDQAAPLLINARNRLSTLEDKFRALVGFIRRQRGRGFVHGEPGIEPDPDDMVAIVGGQIRYGDIPLNAEGTPTGEWMQTYCLCPAHAKMRRDKRQQ